MGSNMVILTENFLYQPCINTECKSYIDVHMPAIEREGEKEIYIYIYIYIYILENLNPSSSFR
jgi:hypothetical protein